MFYTLNNIGDTVTLSGAKADAFVRLAEDYGYKLARQELAGCRTRFHVTKTPTRTNPAIERLIAGMFYSLNIGDVVTLSGAKADAFVNLAENFGYKLAEQKLSDASKQFRVIKTPTRRAGPTRIIQGGAIESNRRSH